MIRVLTYIALLVTITAGSILAYRNQPYSIKLEREGEVKKDQEKVSPPQPPIRSPDTFGPVPHVTVQQMSPAAPTEAPVVRAPTPSQVPAVKKKKRPSAVRELKSKWTAPEAKPFQLQDLFNVR